MALTDGIDLYKSCSGCRQTIPVSEFSIDRKSNDGRKCKCKLCDNSRRAAWHQKTKDKRREINNFRVSTWKRQHSESVSKAAKKWRDRNRQRVAGATRKYCKNNPDKHAAHKAVRRETLHGDLENPGRCQLCGKTGRVEAHHASYAAQYYLDIVWLCKRCHVEIHIWIKGARPHIREIDENR